MKFHRLDGKGSAYLAVLFILISVFTVTQKLWIPELIRPYSFLVTAFPGFLVLFFLIKPVRPLVLSNTLAAILFPVAAFWILVQHVIINFDLTWKAGVILGMTAAGPYLAGLCFEFIKRK